MVEAFRWGVLRLVKPNSLMDFQALDRVPIFNNTEFLLLTLISMTQAVIGILINARTMRRSIDIVPGE
jgi:hypothetical protein